MSGLEALLDFFATVLELVFALLALDLLLEVDLLVGFLLLMEAVLEELLFDEDELVLFATAVLELLEVLVVVVAPAGAAKVKMASTLSSKPEAKKPFFIPCSATFLFYKDPTSSGSAPFSLNKIKWFDQSVNLKNAQTPQKIKIFGVLKIIRIAVTKKSASHTEPRKT